MTWSRSVLWLVAMAMLPPLLAQLPTECLGQQATLLGAVEKVKLLPWGLVLEARVDTGAAKSSMAAIDLRVTGNLAEFRLPDPETKEKVRLPILGWVEVRTNVGKEKRPIVRMEICVAGKRFETLVNLDDRSGLRYPMLLGRESLRGRFLVDVGRSHLHPRPCGEGEGKEGRLPDPGRQGQGSFSSPSQLP
jgi:hypothetical protein